MKVGNYVLEQLSEGFFELFRDGTFVKMDPSRLNEPEEDSSLGKYSSAVGIDPLLIQTEKKNIIIDPGLGWGLDYNSIHANTSNVITNLDVFNLTPQDIDLVILSHLHYDHSAGSTFVSDEIKTQPIFPNANYIVHKEEWEYAINNHNQRETVPGADYKLDELFRLAADNRFLFINENSYSPAKGIHIYKSGGHTPGHLVVKIKSEDETAYFMGDLIPTEHHLNHYPIKQIDMDPVAAKKAKTNILKDAYRENATMFFYHSLYKKTGKLARDNQKKYVLIEP